MRDKLVEMMYSAMLTRENDRLMYGEARLTFEELADYLIDHGVTLAEDNNVLGEWVSGAIQPKESGYYLVVYKDNFTGIRKLCIDRYVKCAAGEWWENDFGRDVTHWMPLPEAPKEDE